MDDWSQTQEWIKAARGGDREAFSQIVGRYRERLEFHLEREVGRRLREKVEIQDCLQETFLQALKSLDQFAGKTEASFRSWLRGIARHVVLNQLRSFRLKARQENREVRLMPPVTPSDSRSGASFDLRKSTRSPSEELRRNERFDRLKRTLGNLKADYAQVIYLACLKGLPVKEVARKMDRTPDAASMLLSRALVKLKTAFGHTESLSLPPRSLEEEGVAGDA